MRCDACTRAFFLTLSSSCASQRNPIETTLGPALVRSIIVAKLANLHILNFSYVRIFVRFLVFVRPHRRLLSTIMFSNTHTHNFSF